MIKLASAIVMMVVLTGSVVYGQSPVYVTQEYVPVVTNQIQYVQQVYPVTTYHSYMVPVSVPMVQYQPVVRVVPFIGPVPAFPVYRPCLFPWGRFYYPPIVVKY